MYFAVHMAVIYLKPWNVSDVIVLEGPRVPRGIHCVCSLDSGEFVVVLVGIFNCFCLLDSPQLRVLIWKIPHGKSAARVQR